jgi:putative membrane protein
VVGDGDSVATILAAEKGFNDRAQIALTGGAESGVKAFAKRMSDDSAQQKQQVTDLAARLGITPPGSPMATALNDWSTNQLATLGSVQGGELDRRYVDGEMLASAALLGLLDATLLASAQNSEYAAWLAASRATIVAHLQAAQTLEHQVDASIGQATGDNGGGTGDNGGGTGDDGGGGG